MPKKDESPKSVFQIPSSVMMQVSHLNPAPYNPRRISPEMLESLKLGIKAHGFLENVVVQKHSPKYGANIILGGHQRIRAVKELCVEDNVPLPPIPCVVIDVDDRTAKKVNVALNNVGGEFDKALLSELLVDMNEDAELEIPEVKVMGLEDDIRSLLGIDDVDMPDDDEPKDFAKSVTLSLVFDSTSLRDKVKKLLDTNAKASKKNTGELVAVALGLTKKK